MAKKSPLTWSSDSRKLSDLISWERNPRFIESDDAARLDESLTDFNQADPLLIGPNNELYDGHQRLDVWSKSRGADFLVDVRVSSRPLTEKEREKLTIIREKSKGQFDFDKLATWDLGDLLEWGFDRWELTDPPGIGFSDGSDGDNDRGLNSRAKSISPVIPIADIGIIERALRATGEKNRGTAFIKICEAYLNEQEQAKGQFDFSF